MKKDTLYVYARVSTEEQALKNYSPTRQKELGKKKAEELGMKCIIFEELGASASRDDFSNRPVMFELIKLVKDGVAKHIFVFDQSRLSRNDITKSIIVNEFRKHSVQLYTFSKTMDFDKAEDILTFNILQAIESYESALRKARFQLGYISGNKKGRFLKGIPPFGYRKLVSEDKNQNGMLVVDTEEKKIFLKIVDLYLNENKGTNQIANWLNDNNIPTKTSKIFKKGYQLKAGIHNRKQTKTVTNNNWNPGTVNSMLKSEIYLGKRRFKTGKDNYELVDVEPILDLATFEKIQAKRSENVITKHKEDKYFYLLKGLMQCGKCGQPLHGRIKPNRGENTYVCNSKREPKHSCQSRGINIDKLNNIVWNSFSRSLYYHNLINKNLTEQIKNPEGLNNRIELLNKDLLKANADKSKNEIAIKKFIKFSASDERISKKLYDETMEEYNQQTKQIDHHIASLTTNIKMLNQRLQKTKVDDSEFEEGLRHFENVEKSITELFGKKLKTKESEIKAQTIIRDSIENVLITWDEKLNEHKIEIKFLPLNKKSEVKSLSIKENQKVKSIGLPPLDFSFDYGAKIGELQPAIGIIRGKERKLSDRELKYPKKASKKNEITPHNDNANSEIV